MANLKDAIINGAARIIGKLFTTNVQVSNTLEVNKIVVTENVTYGTTLPSSGTQKGQIFFKKV